MNLEEFFEGGQNLSGFLNDICGPAFLIPSPAVRFCHSGLKRSIDVPHQ